MYLITLSNYVFRNQKKSSDLITFDLIYDGGVTLAITGMTLGDDLVPVDDVPVRKWHHICIDINQSLNYVTIAVNGLIVANKSEIMEIFKFPDKIQVALIKVFIIM